MSVKFEKETVRGTTPAPLVGGHGDVAHRIGEALTGGNTRTGYLAVSRVIRNLLVFFGMESHALS